MERIEIQAFAKINLCLDVKGLLPGGYHEVHMVMQQIQLHDDVQIRWIPGGNAPISKDPVRITVRTNRPDLPTDRGNLAWRAAEFMSEKYGAGRVGEIQIDMKKQIPVAAGLAGGSSNCAAVIHGMNCLWKLGLSLEELCGFYKCLTGLFPPHDYSISFIHVSDIPSALSKAGRERCNSRVPWIESFIAWVEHTPYGQARCLTGFDGAVSFSETIQNAGLLLLECCEAPYSVIERKA